MRFAAVIVAAGQGRRAGDGPAKQWRLLGGRPVLRWSAKALLDAGADPLVVVVRDDEWEAAAQALNGLTYVLASGGATRTASVRSGLAAIGETDAVLIHDAARPFVGAHHVEALLAALSDADGAVLMLAVADTLRRRSAQDWTAVDRTDLHRIQTPQVFRAARLRSAYAALPATAEETDDAAVVAAAGGKVAGVPGDPVLMKLTYPEDFAMADAIAASRRSTRTGQGFDAHRFGLGEAVFLCGVRIEHDHGLAGHSDADVGLHALTDAILGAIGAGDIGDHFPPTDPQWRGAKSSIFLKKAADLVAEAGGRIVNVDVTLICEEPKIKPHRQAMRAAIAAILQIPVSRVSVKATTTEGMGFTGRREGIAAQALASVETPD